MVFKRVFKRRESFFLDLSSQDARPVTVPIAQPEPTPAAATTPAGIAQPVPASATNAPARPATAPAPSASGAASSGPVLTTAEAIAAELRAAQAAKPAPSPTTFAPEALNPANAMPLRRRRAGANLAGFKAMAKSMTGK